MIIGVPKEVKPDEYRVALTPAGVKTLVERGHTVVVEDSAGLGTWIANDDYVAAGAEIASCEDVWDKAQLILKVKEPQPEEYSRIKPHHILFTYFHFASSESLTRAMIDADACCIAYETVVLKDGTHPLLTPMSEVAGRLSIQQGAKYLERPMGGRGVMLCGVPGVKPAVITIIGAGVVGMHAAKIAAGFGAMVYVLDVNLERLRYISDVFPSNVMTLHSNPITIQRCVSEADLVIGAVYLTGAKAPVLVTRDMLSSMKPKSVVVDVCVDQGGCFETTKPTTHQNPTYEVDDITHYCVTNMPGAVAKTSTYALTNATLPYIVQLANEGLVALNHNESLRKGLNIFHGEIVQQSIADLFGCSCSSIEDVLLAS